MTVYFLEVLVFQGIFLLAYDLFLGRETFFDANRAYLLITPLLAMALPFVEIDLFREAMPEQYLFQLPEIVIGDGLAVTDIPNTETSEALNIPMLVWVFGIFLTLVFFIKKLWRIHTLKRTGDVTKHDGFNLIVLPERDCAFTFLNNIFIGESISAQQREHILLHERVHVNQYHTWDLLFFEVLRMVFWFNPMVYLYQKRMATLQEYTADASVAKKKGKKEYYGGLLSQVFGTENITFINTFFNHSLIKKRFTMLQKSNSKKRLKLKYLLLIPLVGGILLYTSCTQDTSGQANETADLESKSQSEIMQKIAELKESIAAKGSMTPEEEEALKILYVLTNPKGVHVEEFDDVKDKAAIPFGVIHKVPTFPGCEGIEDAAAAKKCFSEKMMQYVASNFNADIGKDLGLVGRQRISVQFMINTQGKVTDVRARAPHPTLEKESIRVVSNLPLFEPGQHQGKAVTVSYHLPIVFDVE
ncbi:M56 family metallopeptidase [Aureisphaera galaxeae]|uniref:M56 family metallopeptidase n=1 Tax=Aureisphaera galaxeae TaxID=1538023 RepID=UPI002350A032|nr:M56 family metallopeptidase [Aureisphaera galaxeae]MDC8002858.1 M56 family metallopeptidase [Aureisphaera galaxeae]